MIGLVVVLAGVMGASTPGTLACGDSPEACRAAILEAWSAGDAARAGDMAAEWLEARTTQDGVLSADGAGLAFIAAIGAYMEWSPSSGYWMWVSARHAEVCVRLPEHLDLVVEAFAPAQGETREVDRAILSGPFLAAARQPCAQDGTPALVPPAVSAAHAPVAIGLYGRSFEVREPLLLRTPPDARMTRWARLWFEYPAGSLSPVLPQASLSEMRRPPRNITYGNVWLRPCTTAVWDRNLPVVCRADQPQPASE